MTLDISVLICTWNRGSLIGSTLESLCNASSQPKEIIVVNGGGENSASECLSLWKERCSVLKVISTQNINLATSRNIGLRACSSKIVAFTDDDAIVNHDWLEKIWHLFETHPEYSAVGGPVFDYYKDSFISQLSDLVTFPRYDTFTFVRHLPGVNVAYRRDFILKVGEQDISLERGEDVDFNWRIQQLGGKLVYCNEVIVYHKHRSTWQGFFKQHYMYGKSYYLVRKKWPEMYSVYPRKISNFFDILKAVNFLLTPFNFAIKNASKISVGYKQLFAFFVFMTLSIVSMIGMLSTRLRE